MRTIEISSPSFRIHRERLANVMKIYISKLLPKFLSKNIFKNFEKNRKIFSFSRFRKSEKSKKIEMFRILKLFSDFPIFPIFSDFEKFRFFRFFRFPKSGKWKYFLIFFFKKFWKCFLIKISAKVSKYKSSSRYPISRDEFWTTATIFRLFAFQLQQILTYIGPNTQPGIRAEVDPSAKIVKNHQKIPIMSIATWYQPELTYR